jgi:predicted RNA binding protein YcfA (HicA-like mRNA interferase family)
MANVEVKKVIEILTENGYEFGERENE